jgi:hypothetical protein
MIASTRLAAAASVVLAVLAGQVLAADKPAPQARQVQFQKTVIDANFRSEGVAVGDVNHDGKLDIIVGDVWYEAPDWKMHEVRPVGKYDWERGYSKCFACFTMDTRGDGWPDVIVVGFPGAPALWYENPRGKEGHWKERTIWKSACNETPVMANLLGSGKPVPIWGIQPEGQMAWFTPTKDIDSLWDMHPISAKKAPSTAQYGHGLGVGDVNGDGRADLIIKDGWWEQPQDPNTEWKFHKVAISPDCSTMWAYDVDGDGVADIISGSAHDYGLWWWKQVKDPAGGESKFEKNLISKDFSEVHAIELVDMNGDGLKDIVTGKRWYAHNGGDPGGKEPAVLYWFELRRPEKGKAEYVPHKIDDSSGVGTQFVVQDMNGDGKPDIIISNKKGVILFTQK